jgi:hypothetical protein
MSIPVFKNSYAPKAPALDKYADALRIIDANLSVNKDGAKINDLKASINGMREEEKAGEISSAEATRNLENLVKMYRGGTRRRRGGDLGKLLNPLIGKPKPKAALVIRDPNGPSPAKPSINGGRSNKKKTHRRRR